MTAKDLIANVTKDCQEAGIKIYQKDVRVIVENVIDNMIVALSEKDTVKLTGFGTFSPIEKAERKGHNPRTGEALIIPAKTTVKFKPSKTLLEEFTK